MDITSLSKESREVLAWLGCWRDKIPDEAVEKLQEIIERNEAEKDERPLVIRPDEELPSAWHLSD